VIYRQFSLTIASSVALSVLVALILTPALCATLLKPTQKGHGARKRGLFGGFNRGFNRSADAYARGVRTFLRHSVWHSLVTALIGAIVVVLFLRAPTGFLPDEDAGMVFAMAQLPPGSTREQANEVLKKMENHFFESEKEVLEGGFGVLGFSFSGNAQNQVLMFLKLKHWDERRRPDQKSKRSRVAPSRNYRRSRKRSPSHLRRRPSWSSAPRPASICGSLTLAALGTRRS
jgi:multidrug efflux pump subunit AcrB